MFVLFLCRETFPHCQQRMEAARTTQITNTQAKSLVILIEAPGNISTVVCSFMCFEAAYGKL
jgi:hypothetical protein